MKKCVIIGSGLGGLSCGCILAKNGYEVTVLEQGAQIGGCLQCFVRDGITFNTGMHYIGSADKGQTLHTIMDYLGIIDDISLDRLDPNGYDVISFKGKEYRLANGREQFVAALAEHFPDSRDELYRYYDLVQTVTSSYAVHSLNKDTNININAEYQFRSINEVIDSIISNPLLREVLVGISPLYAGVIDRTPFSTHALITDCYNQSAFRIVGGSAKVAESLHNTIKKNGGKVLTRKKAEQIECDNDMATAVISADGERFEADLVISAIHPASTIKLVNSRLLRPAYRKRILSLENTVSTFIVYLKFKPQSVKYMNHNLYLYLGDNIWGCEDYDEHSWPQSLLYMHFCHEEKPVYAEGGEVIAYMNYDEVRQWEGTMPGRRGKDYEEFKRKKAEKVLETLERKVPELRGNIEAFFTSTPLTYADYTGIPEGSMYGVAKDVTTQLAGRISHRTHIPNLLLTGQSITSHGMFGVLAGSVVTCSEVLTLDTIYKQLTINKD